MSTGLILFDRVNSASFKVWSLPALWEKSVQNSLVTLYFSSENKGEIDVSSVFSQTKAIFLEQQFSIVWLIEPREGQVAYCSVLGLFGSTAFATCSNERVREVCCFPTRIFVQHTSDTLDAKPKHISIRSRSTRELTLSKAVPSSRRYWKANLLRTKFSQTGVGGGHGVGCGTTSG